MVFLLTLSAILVAANFMLEEERGSRASSAPAGVERYPAASPDRAVSLVFDFKGAVERHRLEVAATVLARQEAELERRRERRRKLAPFLKLPTGVSRATLETIAACESGGDPQIVSSSGFYHGKYQFSPATWATVGGSGLPSEAPEVEQDYRAALLYVRSGPGQWPVCG